MKKLNFVHSCGAVGFRQDFIQKMTGFLSKKTGDADEIGKSQLRVPKRAAFAFDADFDPVEGVFVQRQLKSHLVAGKMPLLSVFFDNRGDRFGKERILLF